MLSDAQLEKLANGNPEDAAQVLLEPSSDVTNQEVEPQEENKKTKEELERELQSDALKKANELPFDAKQLGDYSFQRFLDRKAGFIENSERQVREAVAYGCDEVTLGTLGAYNYHLAVKAHFEAAGFSVKEKDVGTEKSALVVTIYK